MRRRDAALLILLGVSWGAVYPLTALALRGFSPAGVVAGRAALAAVVLVPAAARAGVLGAVRGRPAALAAGAILQATIPVTLLTLGQQHVGAGLAGIILASQPVWAAVLTGVVDRTVRTRELAGVVAGLAGITLLSWPGHDTAATSAWGLAALIGAAASYAAGAIYIQRVIPDIPPLLTASAAMTVTAVILLPFAAAGPAHLPGWVSFGWLAVLAVAATGLPLVLYYQLIHRVGPVRASLAGYLAPGFALLGSVFLGQPLTGSEIGGLALILAGSYAAAGTPRGHRRDPRGGCAGSVMRAANMPQPGMTPPPKLCFTRYAGGQASRARDTVEAIYRDSYSREPREDPFSAAARWMARFDTSAALDGFDLVIARSGTGEPAGQAWGWPLLPDTSWWDGLSGEPQPGFTTEDGHRTFAVSEIMVRQSWTGQGIAHALHDELLRGRREHRATLLVRPVNTAAYRAYISWGWKKAAQLQPDWPDAPVFDVLILPLPLEAS